ncbi:methyl-accepting chemotaxis protein [Aliiruegeria sabulilitoris]|uniref:methyl-accepting chemotaxis protein n=1 Tax=Aliiruegeria sabulilitoris TaxID=1510458 RepID=UPI0008348073|nr:HAMP domain-containing methyl-accepting chemotaxis protein [Aliiruegeria sabulilitoris]NDR56804.1 HAMP domain-containing protein [Pseudoruegeria sp. M32A2M]
MKPFRLNLSVKSRILVLILSALSLFVVGYSLFWSARYTTQLETAFQNEMRLAPQFLTTPVAAAVWDFQPEAAEAALAGLEMLDSASFARVLEGGEATVQYVREGDWQPRWDGLLKELNVASTEEQTISAGEDVVLISPLIAEDGSLLGQLVFGFSRASIGAKIRDANIWSTTIGIVAFAVFVVITLFIASSVTRPLNRLIDLIDRMRGGETDFVSQDSVRRDEFGNLGRAVEEFRDNLIETQKLQREEAESRQEQEALKAKLADEEAARAEEAERSRVERELARDREAAEKARAEEQRQAEREARAAEQSQVVEALSNALGAMSKGDLGARLEEAFPSDYEVLRHNFNEAVDRISRLVGAIVQGAQGIRNEIGTLNSATTEMGHRTESQAASLEETAAAITELSASVDNSNKGAQESTDTVVKTRRKTETGRGILQETIGAMSEISQSSGKISKITKVIDDIAFQTNLLALNAGVEAARAGEAGRGFSVVASEVRALAQRSSEAAKEIAELISTSGEQVESGVALVEHSGEALTEIDTMVATLNTLVEASAEASTQQSATLAEIMTAVNRLDQVTQQNAAMFKETTAAVGTLQAQADSLENNAAAFRLGVGAEVVPLASRNSKTSVSAVSSPIPAFHVP